MPLQFNGVTIPENVANALTVNGIAIKDVYFNGVKVWHQSLFAGVWSGSSLVSSSAGLQTSGSAYRATINGVYGDWLYANSNGMASGTTTATNFFKVAFTTTPTTISFGGGTGTVTFVIGSGFSGTSLSGSGWGLKTSGGLIAFTDNASTGTWISLT